MDTLAVTRPGPEAREALWAAIAAIKERDPLAPVSVVVPSPYAALSLRRGLAAARGGFVNVHFVVLNRVAELLGAPFLTEPRRRPLTPPVATEVTRLALLEAPVPGLVPEPRAVAAVVATFREAIRAGVRPSGALGAAYDAGRARVAGSYYDDEDQLGAAADAVRDATPALADVGTVVWFLPGQVTPGTTAFARALAAGGLLHVIAARTGDPVSDRRLVELADTLERPGPEPDVGPGREPITATRIVVAPDHDSEVRTVTRAVLALARRGTPFHRIAVTFAIDDPYARLVPERFAAAAIPMAGPAPRRLAETAAGRVLLTSLRAASDDVARDAVLDLLSCAPLDPRVADARRVARWDRCSREAGIVSGAREWRARLRAWSERHASEDDGTRDRDDATRLAEIVEQLAPAGDRWSDRATHRRGVLDRLLGDGRHLPDHEREALMLAHDTLRALASLDELGGEGTTFDDAVVAALDTPIGRLGTVGTGVLVAPMTALAGCDFDAVFVLGLTDSATAAGTLDDPLLPGHGLAAHRRHRRRAAYLDALAVAPERVVSFPRADLRAARAVMPSPWLLESASALASRPVASRELLTPTPASAPPWLHAIPSLEALLGDAPPSADEAGLAALHTWRGAGADLAAFPLDDRELARGFEALRARASDRAGRWDGVTGPLDGLAPDDEHAFSATRLEPWATCPFRYFLRSVLGASVPERPEVLDRIEPRVRGELIHEALREFLAAHVGKPPHERWSDAERDELLGIVTRAADAAEARGLVGHPTLWSIDRRRLLAETQGFLDVDDERRAEAGVSPWLQEVGFGHDDDGGDDLAPLELELGGRAIRFRGRIDRVDRSPDGRRVEVYDYKTGRPRDGDLVDDPVAAGERLQPVLYGLVARREAPGATVGSHYWYTRAPAGDALDGITTVDEGSTLRLRDALATVTHAITQGQFPREPGEDSYFGPTHCRSCDYDRACPAERVRVAEGRYGHDPAFEALRALRGDDPS